MKIIVRTSLCAAVAACATAILAAQTTSSPQTNTSTTDQKTVVVTGCLKEAPPSSMPAASATIGTTGTTGTAGTTATAESATDTAPSPKYVLTNAAAAPAGATGASTTTGTPGVTPAPSGTQTYRLIANMSALTPHVGKKLELTGVLEDQNGAAPGSETAGGADVNTNSPTLRVQSGKIVAASCTP